MEQPEARELTPSADRRVVDGLLPEPIGPMPVTALETLTRSELETQITTARRFPRSLALFKANALSLVRLDQATAAACFYALPRRQRGEDGTVKRVTITGPSVRLAEIVAGAWGNLRAGARIVGVEAGEVVAQGYAHDLQTNYAIVTETRRRIVDREGRRYSDDLVVVTQNAACAIARRNAMFAVIPRAYVNQLVAVAMKVAAGDESTLVDTRRAVLAELADLGAPPARVCDRLERGGVSDLDLDDVGLLRGLVTAIRDGETTVAAEFPAPAGEASPSTSSRSAALADTVRRRRHRKAEGGAPAARGAEAPAPTPPAAEAPAAPAAPSGASASTPPPRDKDPTP
jgi:hypothetical protein